MALNSDLSTILARKIKNGIRPQIGSDPGGCHEDGSPVEGPWFIQCGDLIWCYYRTREECRDIIREAKRMAGDTTRKVTYEIRQDNANNRRVIRTENGVSRAIDHPPCRTVKAARELIRDERQFDRENPDRS